MINKFYYFRIQIIMILLVFTIISSLSAQTDMYLNGIWTNSYTESFDKITYNQEIRFNNGNYEITSISKNEHNFFKGTFTTNNGILIFRKTHIMFIGGSISSHLGLEEATWHTQNEYMTSYKNFMIGLGSSQEVANRTVESMNELTPWNYYIVVNSLILSFTKDNGEKVTEIWTKK